MSKTKADIIMDKYEQLIDELYDADIDASILPDKDKITVVEILEWCNKTLAVMNITAFITYYVAPVIQLDSNKKKKLIGVLENYEIWFREFLKT